VTRALLWQEYATLTDTAMAYAVKNWHRLDISSPSALRIT